MVSNNTMKVKRSDNAIWRVIDGEIVVLLTDGDVLHALKGCGSRVWELIEGETTISEIVQSICAQYEVEPQIAEKDITEFVRKLASMKLLEIVSGVGEEVSC